MLFCNGLLHGTAGLPLIDKTFFFFFSFSELLRVCVVRGSDFFHGPDAGSV